MASVKKRAKIALQHCGTVENHYRNQIVKIAKALLKMNHVIILSHRAPDGDTLGCAFALCRGLRSLGKNAIVKCADEIPAKYAFMYEGMDEQSFEAEHIVSVDIASPNLLGKLADEYKDRIEICVDHHLNNTVEAPIKLVDTKASATGEIIWLLLQSMDAKIDREIAACLFAAISTDTGCFKYGNVTQRTHLIAVELMKYEIDCAKINFSLLDEVSPAQLELKKLALNTLEYCCDNRCAIITVTSDMISQTNASPEDLDGLSNIPRSIRGVECGITLREITEGWKVSIRSSEKVNASELCAKFGGGGHKAAAGCRFSTDCDEAKKQLIDAVSEYLK
jgi:Exopolyphosphatase-related proteins